MTSVYLSVIVKNYGALSYFFWTGQCFMLLLLRFLRLIFEVVVEFPSLETSKDCVDAILCHVLWAEAVLSGRWD